MTASKQIAAHVDTVREFNRFYTQRIGVLGRNYLGSDYSLTEGRVLFELARRKRALASEIIADLSLDPGYVSRIVKGFSARGWLRRATDPNDRRRSVLSLSARGRAALAELDRRAQLEVTGLLTPLSPSAQRQLDAHLQGAKRLLDAEPDSAAQPRQQLCTLRQHRSGDIGWIISRHGALYADEYQFNEEFEALVAEICARFLRRHDPERERCWVAEYGGAPVGTIMLVKQRARVAQLRLLLVEPSARGLGVGRALVETCVAFAQQAGYKKIVLWTQSTLTAARALYAANGFERTRVEPHDSFGQRLDGEFWERTFARG